MAYLHTAHLSTGKAIPKNGNVIFLDTTAKSGSTEVERALAPTWDLVAAYKAGTIDEKQYTKEYLVHLNNAPEHIQKWLHELAKDSRFTDVIVSCYDGVGKFCHRYILQRWLTKVFGFEEGWEVTYKDVETITNPNGSILSLSKSEHITSEDVLNEFKDEIASGEVALITEDYVVDLCKKRGKCVDINTECTLERAMLNWIVISEITKPRKDNGKTVTYIDTTRLIDTMFEPDGLSHNPSSNVAELVQGYVNNRAVWKPLVVKPDHSLRQLVQRFGFESVVTISKSYENLDHAASMDTLYEEVDRLICNA